MSSTESNQQVVQDLKAAKAELVKRGRCRGRTVNDEGQVCILGAIGAATVPGFEELDTEEQERTAYGERQQAVRRALRPFIPDGDFDFIWNDSPATGDADVLNLFDKALAELGGLGDE